jgi:hypothetical protein
MMDTAQTLSSVYFRVNFLLHASIMTNLIDERWGGVKQLLLLFILNSQVAQFHSFLAVLRPSSLVLDHSLDHKPSCNLSTGPL